LQICVHRKPLSSIGGKANRKYVRLGNSKPKQVDSTALSGPGKGQVTKGIYEIIDANNKRACWGKPGGPRPSDFTSEPGSGRTGLAG
jgi:uncharacterized protein (TIGR03067 family)